MSTSISTSRHEKICDWLRSEHVEVTLRMGVAMFLGYVLAFSDPIFESTIPVDQNILLAILVPFCVMLFPTLMFSFGTLVLPLCSVFLLIQLLATLLSAIGIAFGNAAFVVAFCAVSFWASFTRFDKVEGNKTSLILVGIVYQSVLIFPNFMTMKNGIRLYQSPTDDVPTGLPPVVEQQLFALVAGAVAEATNLGVGTHSIEIGSDPGPMSSSALYGRTAEIEIYEDGSSETYIEGGMWLLAEAWNFSGGYTLQNPFAKHVHILVLAVLMTLVLAVAILMPPFRTMRSAVWRGIIPAAMMDASDTIRLHAGRLESSSSNGQPEAALQADDAATKAKRRGKSVYHINALFGGNLAKYSVFEPRLLACKPPEWTVATLVQLSEAVSRCVRIAVGIEVLTELDDGNNRDGDKAREQRQFMQENTQHYLKIADTLEQCGKAVRTGDANLLAKLLTKPEPTKGDEAEDTNVNNAGSSQAYDPFHFQKHTDSVVTLSKNWLEAMDPAVTDDKTMCSSESFFAFRKNGEPWILIQLSHFIFLGNSLINLFRKSSWEALMHPSQNNALPQLVWCAKYALGMTLLLVFPLYWPAFRKNFVIMDEDDPYRSLFALQNCSWAIVAYCFATTQTVEGSVKKGLLRMAGTVTGGLSGWLALVACEDERFAFQYNTYGIVAYQTITSALAVFVATERGFAARVSLSSDYAFGPIYFVITQGIIIGYGYFYYEQESRYEIAMNRMVANLFGIAMAVLLAVIPPGIWGGDPKHCLSMVHYHQNKIGQVIEQILKYPNDKSSDLNCAEIVSELRALSAEIRSHSAAMQAIAVDFEKDASKLRSMPRFQVDPRLKIEIAKVTRDTYIVAFLPMLAAFILEDGEKRACLLGSNSRYRKDLETLIGSMRDESIPKSTTGIESLLHQATTDAETDSELLVRVIVWLWGETKQHKTVLETIRWGI